MTIEETSHLAALGWDARWAAAFSAATEASSGGASATTWSPARVVAEHRGRYAVAGDGGERSAVLAGRLRHTATSREDLPTVGDWVAIAAADHDGTTTIHLVLPRRSAFVRKDVYTVEGQVVAANVDVALIATALPDDLNLHRLDRYLTLGWESGATPIVVLTKADLALDVPRAVAAVRAATHAADVVAISAATGEGLDRLAGYLMVGRTAVLLGSSGVGKSTLVNRLLGEAHLRTAAVREDGRGRHTTTHRELVTLANGALLIDTPGMRELQLWTADDGLDAAFADIDTFAEQCRFRDCGHDGEPGCAVLDAVRDGALPQDRLEHWRKLRRELAYLAQKQDERAASAARARARSLTRGVRSHLRDKYGP